MHEDIEAVKEKMLMMCKVLQKQRVLDGYGHLTARLSDGRIVSTPHMPPGKIALRDLTIMNPAGPKPEAYADPNGEPPIHPPIKKPRPTARASFHYNPVG